MSAYKFVTLTCDDCGAIWDDSWSLTNRQARKASRASGWFSNERTDTDLCKECKCE